MPNAAIAASASPLATGAPLLTGSLEGVAERLGRAKRYAIAIIVAWFAIAISPSWLPTPDSALYLMLGRSVAQGHGYTLDGHPHAYVPPGFPYMLAALERVGLGSMLCLNIAMALIGVASVWMSYLLVSQLASRPVALLVACLLGCNSLLHVMSALQLSDMPFTLLVLAGLYGFVRGLRGDRWALELGTLAILGSCWIRVAGVSLSVACAVGLVLQPRATSRLRLAGNVAALLLGVAATLGLYYAQYQNTLRAEHSLPPASYMAGVQALLAQPFGALIKRTLGNVFESAAEIPRFLMGLQGNPVLALAVCLVPAVVGIARRLRHREFLIALAVAGYAAGIVMNLPAGARYLLPVAPLLILYYLEGLTILLDWRPRVRRWAPQLLVLFVAVFVAFNGVKGAYVMHKNVNQIAATREAIATCAEWLHENARPGDHFLSCDAEWQMAYLSQVPYMQIDRWVVIAGKTREEYLRLLYDQGVRLVVAVPETRSHYPDEALIREAVRDTRMFQPLASNQQHQLYRFIAPPPVATPPVPPSPVAASPRTRGALLQ
jgi:4-amino-4-deoxy-L-arabinose transferase-like glycosyltransferase